MEILQIPVLNDNYTYLLFGERETAVVDSPEAGPIVSELEKRGRKLDYIFNTHHHGDHVGANLSLKERYSCQIWGPEKDRIPGIDRRLKGGDSFSFGGEEVRVLDTSGHTLGHISFYFAQSAALFCGDSLFSLGCGRLFEGTKEQLWNGLERIRALPGETKIYCAHEYTLENAEFAVRVERKNRDLFRFVEQAQSLRDRGLPTVPSLMKDELACNPFLRTESAEIRKLLGGDSSWSGAQWVGALRETKDLFDSGKLKLE